MKYAHLIKLNIFSKEIDNYEKISKKFKSFFPFDLEKEKVNLKKTTASGFEDKEIIILEATLTKERHIKEFLKNLLKNLDDAQKKNILDEAESRLDENSDFFLRFDKDELVEHNKLVLTDSGNCFHIKISIAAFPKKRDIALENIKNIFGGKIFHTRKIL